MKKLLSGSRYVIEQSIIHPLCRIGVKLLRFMMRVMLLLLLRVGRPLVASLAAKTKQGVPNLEGCRHVEWSWVLSHLGTGPGDVLDFGCGETLLSFAAARRGYNVTAIDLQSINWPYMLPNMCFIRCDILKSSCPLQNQVFDLIINCSSIEHVGLPGRYGSEDNPEGDITAMTLMCELLRSGGVMLLTIPVGRDTVFAPLHRVYGRERLPRLLNQWIIEEKEYWVKDDQNRWIAAEESVALDRDPTELCYGLGCFVLAVSHCQCGISREGSDTLSSWKRAENH